MTNDLSVLLNLACLKYTGNPLPDEFITNDWKYKKIRGKKIGVYKIPNYIFKNPFYSQSYNPIPLQLKRKIVLDEFKEILNSKKYERLTLIDFMYKSYYDNISAVYEEDEIRKRNYTEILTDNVLDKFDTQIKPFINQYVKDFNSEGERLCRSEFLCSSGLDVAEYFNKYNSLTKENWRNPHSSRRHTSYTDDRLLTMITPIVKLIFRNYSDWNIELDSELVEALKFYFEFDKTIISNNKILSILNPKEVNYAGWLTLRATGTNIHHLSKSNYHLLREALCDNGNVSQKKAFWSQYFWTFMNTSLQRYFNEEEIYRSQDRKGRILEFYTIIRKNFWKFVKEDSGCYYPLDKKEFTNRFLMNLMNF